MLLEPFKLKNTTFNQYETLRTCKNSGKQLKKSETDQ